MMDRTKPEPYSASSGSLSRSAEALRQVVDQFKVETNPRYQPDPGAGITWCNIFLWDVTRALACEVPHWWVGRELTANEVADWLTMSGPVYGWMSCAPETAAQRASLGYPTIAVWKNPSAGHHGHVAVVLPGGTIAQAGLHNLFDVPVASGFGSITPVYFTHE